LEDFPFDEQTLKLEIEEAIYDTSTMIYMADRENSKYDANNIALNGWRITHFEITPQVKTYETTYGDPELKGESSYPAIKILVTIKRIGNGLFFKLFTGVYVAFLITMMVFFIDPTDVDPRFGLSVGGLFAAVGNKYIVDSNLPETTSFTLVDKIHSLTFCYILASIVLSVVSLHFYKKDNPRLSKKIDLWAFSTFGASYVLINTWLIIVAILR